MSNQPIGVFDSGVGGLSVLNELRKQMPSEDFLYYGDSANAPYGNKTTMEIRELTFRAVEHLLSQGAKAIVIACNTATSAAIQDLREAYPDKILIGIEPALKLAVERHPGGRILIMATETTLREKKLELLVERFRKECEILPCHCPELVGYIERGIVSGEALEAYLQKAINPELRGNTSAIVLGCTHYPFVRDAISSVVGPQVELLDGANGTARETRRRLQEAGMLKNKGPGRIDIQNSDENMMPLCWKLLEK